MIVHCTHVRVSQMLISDVCARRVHAIVTILVSISADKRLPTQLLTPDKSDVLQGLLWVVCDTMTFTVCISESTTCQQRTWVHRQEQCAAGHPL